MQYYIIDSNKNHWEYGSLEELVKTLYNISSVNKYGDINLENVGHSFNDTYVYHGMGYKESLECGLEPKDPAVYNVDYIVMDQYYRVVQIQFLKDELKRYYKTIKKYNPYSGYCDKNIRYRIDPIPLCGRWRKRYRYRSYSFLQERKRIEEDSKYCKVRLRPGYGGISGAYDPWKFDKLRGDFLDSPKSWKRIKIKKQWMKRLKE